jgi:hypothetical protein
MKILTLPEADRSPDIDIKMVAGRASRYRVFGSPERILDAELAVVDLRDGVKPDDYEERFRELDHHVAAPIFLVRKLG